ncbi:flagellar export protein FliJ [Vibrio sp. J1-1]|uniref:flagellar export protein FliJ n=1 Tax=Vibrio sp. J1-1 TaxID=2912251 RepID=UPI001F3971A9|nr:flagellar export protein FliJ [Vibrio sp. J1-1]MCF7480382.1 flagellar export protein FliJ [Vibrio sp. J1-1]
MEAKLRAVGQFQKIQEKNRDLMSQQLESMRQQHTLTKSKLEQLTQLRSLTGSSVRNAPSLNSEALMNLNRVDQMLQKIIVHQENEQAVMQAQCTSLQRQIEYKQMKVKGLEKVLENWHSEQRYQKQKLEEHAIEEIVNSRCQTKLF